jgi:type III pantothenate kinase
MQLCIDIGNTRTKWGVFRERELVAQGVFDDLGPGDIVAICKQYPVSSAIYMAVKEPLFEIETVISLYCPVQRLHSRTPLPFTNLYSTPETLGSDRLALAAGAIALFPDQYILVISAGTCITFDLVDDRANYHGGSIHPGVRMRLQAMHTFTGKLPLAEPEIPDNITGNTTVSSLQIGAVTGAAKEIEGMITAYIQQYPGLQAVLTGGDAPLLVAMLENKIFALPTLSLTGLNEIQLYHASEK